MQLLNTAAQQYADNLVTKSRKVAVARDEKTVGKVSIESVDASTLIAWYVTGHRTHKHKHQP